MKRHEFNICDRVRVERSASKTRSVSPKLNSMVGAAGEAGSKMHINSNSSESLEKLNPQNLLARRHGDLNLKARSLFKG